MSALQIGDHRLGHVYDGDENNPELVIGVLSRDAGGIWLDLSWEDRSPPIVRRWFGDLRTPLVADPKTPQQVTFEDHGGPVVLVGLRPERVDSNRMGAGQSRGRFRVSYAVVGTQGGGVDYTAGIHAMSSEIDGLRRFMRSEVVQSVPDFDGEGKLLGFHFPTKTGPEVSLDRRSGMTVKNTLRLGGRDAGASTELRHDSLCVTRFTQPREWTEHIRAQKHLSDLLSVAYWYPCLFTSHVVQRMDGTDAGNWHWVDTAATEIGLLPPMPGTANPLFDFDGIGGANGVTEWLRQREAWSRAFDPLVALPRLRSTFLDVQFTQLGIGLEALGNYIALERGYSRTKAKNESVSRLLMLILDDAPLAQPYFDNGWAEETAQLYNQVKHVDRRRPEPARLHARLVDSILLFRLWVAGRLGAKIENLDQMALPDSRIPSEHWDDQGVPTLRQLKADGRDAHRNFRHRATARNRRSRQGITSRRYSPTVR